MKKINGIQAARIITLVFFLVLITVMAALHQAIGGGPKGAPSIDSLCPFGGLETIYRYLSSAGEYIKRTNASNFILLGGTAAIAVVAGRFFCGWICMVGFLQELFGRIGMKLFKRRFVIPSKYDRPLRYLKYAVLIAVLFLTWRTGELIIRPYDPFVAYAHIPAGLSVFSDLLWGLVILAGSLTASMFVDRFFCKYLCPMGAFLGIINKLSIFRIKRNEKTCIHCSKCSRICPVNIDVEKTDVVRSSECINCMECITVCPTADQRTMSANITGKFVKLIFVVIMGLGLYAGIVGTSMIAGIWKTEDTALEESIKEGGVPDPDNIRGFMTMEEIAKTFNLNVNDLYAKLGISKNKIPVTTQMKKVNGLAVKDGLDIGEDEIRNAVKELAGMKNDDAVKNDGSVIENTVNGVREEEKYKAVVDDKSAVVRESVPQSSPDPGSIKGTMTLKEIAEMYKVDLEKLYEKLDLKRDTVPETTEGRDIKNILSKEGRDFEVQEIRDAVKELMK